MNSTNKAKETFPVNPTGSALPLAQSFFSDLKKLIEEEKFKSKKEAA